MLVYKSFSFFYIKQYDKTNEDERLFDFKAIYTKTSFEQKYIII